MALTFGIVPSTDPRKARAALARFTERLEGALGVPVDGVVAESYASLVSAFERDKVDVAWMPPALMVLADEQLRLKPLVSAVRGDRTAYRAVLFVDARSPWQSVEQLAGRTVGWVDPLSAAGYLYPRLHLAARGIAPQEYFGHERFLKSHHAVARAVLDGKVDVGATWAERPAFGSPIQRAGFVEVAPAQAVRVLEWTGLIPNDLIVARGLLALETRTRVAQALLQLSTAPDGRAVLLGLFEADRFMLASSRALGPLKHLVKLAREQGLLLQL